MSSGTCLYADYYQAFVQYEEDMLSRKRDQYRLVPAFELLYRQARDAQTFSGWTRIKRCIRGLEALDRRGWKRSFHQRQFHDQFLRASIRVFWKTEEAGKFQREHRAILEAYGWESLPQEMLISTPRRFGKTISVSMFVAAMIYAAPRIETSIYSTCKRISQKLLANVAKFLALIFEELGEPHFPVIRKNMEEILLRGIEGSQDVRIVNSYPSKVTPSSL